MIYIDENIWDFDLQETLATVSPQRRQQALRYCQERDQRLCVAAYRLLQRALLQEYGITDLPQFTYDNKGKPSLIGHNSIHFSLSHCREAVACAVSDRPIGIDIEMLDHYSEKVAALTMNEEEMVQIKTSPHPNTEFTRLWTMKESLLKATGYDNDGDIANMLSQASLCHFVTITTPDYIITTCQENI